MRQKDVLSETFSVFQLLVAHGATDELVGVRVLDMNRNLILDNRLTDFTPPFVLLQLLPVILQMFDQLESILANKQANWAAIVDRAAARTNHANVIVDAKLRQELATALVAVKVVRCGIHLDAIVVSSGMGFLVMFDHFRLEREKLLADGTENFEVNSAPEVQMLRVNVLRQIVLRCEVFVVEVAGERSNVEMVPENNKNCKILDLKRGLKSPSMNYQLVFVQISFRADFAHETSFPIGVVRFHVGRKGSECDRL